MKRAILLLLSLSLAGCAPTMQLSGIDQFKEFDAKLNADIRADAQQEIVNCNTKYNIPDIEKKQCALCGEYVLYVMDWKDAKKAQFHQLLDMLKIPETLGDGKLQLLTAAADIAYGGILDQDPKAQLDAIGDEALKLWFNLKSACSPLVNKYKALAIKLGIAVGEGALPIPNLR